jgi:hypothetical protein
MESGHVSPTRDRIAGTHFNATFGILGIACLALVIFIWFLDSEGGSPGSSILTRQRSFYGIVEIHGVGDDTGLQKVTMVHGTVNHGSQFLGEQLKGHPTTYFGPESGVGQVLQFHPLRYVANRQFNIGVIGLGGGTLSAYANNPMGKDISISQMHDKMVYYEINSDVLNLANEYFSYSNDAVARGAEIEYVLGDARVQLEKELSDGMRRRYDIFVIDAFSGDSIPMHLLTRECFDIYLSHLASDGIIAFHVSNRYLDLIPVIEALTLNTKFQARLIKNSGSPSSGELQSTWVIVHPDSQFINELPSGLAGEQEEKSVPILWTDDYASLLHVLK